MRKFILYMLSALSFVILGSASGCSEADVREASENQTTETAVAKNTADEKIEEEVVENVGVKVKLSTIHGDMTILLYDETPLHRDNFVKLVKEGFYNDLLFHRIIRNFMIQGGDPDSKGAPASQRLGVGGPGYTIDAEFHDNLIHKKGALAAARRGGPSNPGKKSSGSQFYIVQGRISPEAQLKNMEMRRNQGKDSLNFFHYSLEQIEAYSSIGGTPNLDGDYTVFGEVIEGLEVVDIIASVQTAPGDRPVEDVKMTITIIE